MSKFTLNLSANLTAAKGWFQQTACAHPVEQQSFVRNICGAEIQAKGGMRSIWQCRKCGTELYRGVPFEN